LTRRTPRIHVGVRLDAGRSRTRTIAGGALAFVAFGVAFIRSTPANWRINSG
jgi:hypothetical protein